MNRISICILILFFLLGSFCSVNKIIIKKINGKIYEFIKDKYFQTYYNKISGTLAKDTKIKELYLKKNDIVSIDKNGYLKYIIPKKDTTINGIRFKATNVINFFFKTTKVRRGYLAKPQIINKVKVKNFNDPNNKYILFHESGAIERANLSEDTVIQGIKFKVDNSIGFYGNGQIYHGTLSEKKKFKYVELPLKTKISLSKSGKLSSFEIENITEETVFNNIKYISYYYFYLYESGYIKSGILAQDVIIDNIKLYLGTKIEYYSSGKIKSVKLSKKTRINGKAYKADELINFSELKKNK